MRNRNRVIASLGLVGVLCAGAAVAREPDVRWSVTIGSQGHAPVYVQPRPVYVEPVYPSRHYPSPHYYSRHYQEPTRWDRDGDGIPNRHDRLHNPAWDRDGDGVPNRYDRYDRYDGRRGDWRR